MTRSWIIGVVVATVTLSGCAQTLPALQPLVEAADAMGGERTVRDATSLVVEGKGRSFRLGQNKNPYGELPYYEVSQYKRSVDLVNGRMRVELVRTSAYYTGSPVYDQRVVSGIDGDVAYNVNDEGTQQRTNAQAARDRRIEMYHHPVALIRTALDEASGATVGNLREEGGQTVVDITMPTGELFTLYVDSETNLPSKIVSPSYDTNLGDVVVSTVFEDYGETGGFGGFSARLTLPRTLTTVVDQFKAAEWRVTSNINQEVGDLAASDAVRTAGSPEYQANVQVEEVAPGVWALAGQSHHSVLVEFPQYSVLVEAPQHDGRTLAVIQKARELVPTKPLRYVVNTHHHFDHSGGIRAAVAEGLTVVTHETNRKFIEEIVSRPHTRMADHLSSNAKPLMLETVTANAKFELRDGARVMEIYRITDDLHNDGILMVYLPRERILIEADAFAANSAQAPFAANLLKNIQDRGLRVDRIVPIHGPIATFDQLQEAAKQGAARTD